MRNMIRVLGVAFLVMSAVSQGPAQVTSGTIVGAVTDSTGAVVPNANITLVNQGTKDTRKTQTNDRGEFRIAGLRPGTVAVAAVDVRSSVNVFSGQGRPDPPKKTYYPHASTLADAEPIALQFGEEYDGIDLVVSAEQPALPPVQQLRLQSGQLVLARGTSTVRGGW